jgi:hypothetical protein
MSEVEIIMVCQIPVCGAMADAWEKDGHEYFFCDECAPAMGWCVECRQYVGADNVGDYDMCPDCLDAAPEDYAAIGAAIDDVLASEPHCPHCEGIDVTLTHDGGWCDSCNQTFDAAVYEAYKKAAVEYFGEFARFE